MTTFLTTSKAAEMLGVSRHTVIRWIANGRLRANQYVPGGRFFIELNDAAALRVTTVFSPSKAKNKKKAPIVRQVKRRTKIVLDDYRRELEDRHGL